MKRQAQLLLLAAIAVLVLFYLQHWQQWILNTLNVGLSLTVVFIGIIIFLENRNPTKTITWLMLLALFPVVGFIFYIAFGQSYRKKRLFRKRAYLEELSFEASSSNGIIDYDKLQLMGEHQQSTIRLAQRLGQYPVSFATETRVLTNGDATFREIINAISQAKHHIHLEYYIIRDDGLGSEIRDLLIEKAQQGVEVRLLYDSVGSWRLPKRYVNELKKAGIKTVPFFPVKLPFFNHKINFRNHRKIVVIDGKIGFTGGLNIGDEYLGKSKSFGFWRDTHLLVKGEAVRSLQAIFLQDWYYMTGEFISDVIYFQAEPVHKEGNGAVQLVSSSPDDEWEVIKNLFFSMIVSAKRSIWIASPYLIPDEDILSALKVAALGGIDVKLLVPKHPDKKIVFYASHSYFPELLEAGVNIHEYQNGFLHSKVIIVDHELASIGTANMDMRSFHLNFEVNAFLYRTESTIQLVADFIDDLENSVPIDWEVFKKRPILIRVFESTSRLLSPLL
ncbi:cardiolipin synthase [Pullulanibacillus pueri]|uniref:Cardiolipin synthase n=1 Tax=Pullulanibacillus pueri TaxID=1437324 RepID=A0A8J2ZWY3_9BACL|nr:cardiolipin synthase [Pullulanibacillus pueri]MBM7680592.1 cardiolipin synthase [Pullulanibacillus pueri]GGH83998.1 cardiolipin synthase 2 [Pullulanibacillus pueri]